MRTGANYQDSLRDGRRVWVMGDGLVDDVTIHTATAGMVAQYVAWFDRHTDPAWGDTLLTAAGTPVWTIVPRTAADLRRMGKAYAATIFRSAGNITHTPAYGHLIALGIETTVRAYNKFPAQIEAATAYRESIAATGRFLTFSAGAATIGARLSPDPASRAALRVTGATEKGLYLTGKVGMHTSPAYAEDVYIGAHNGADHNGHRVTCIVPVNAPGVTILCRKVSIHAANPFLSPLSARNDELDGQMWLDNVFIPNERLFYLDPGMVDPIARWLFWHQLYCWLAKGEFALGLALALTDAMGLIQHQQTIEMLLDMVTDVQTVRTCLTAAELDPSFTPEGFCYPNHAHIAVGSIAMLHARQRLTETLRVLPGSSLIVAPSDTDLAAPEVGRGLDESFAGGGYTALQRSALLQMAWDHAGSALDARESVYELQSNGGIPVWRSRLRQCFGRYNELANAVLREIAIDMPRVDVSAIPSAPVVPRRPVTPPSGKT